jgi:hypothetical protein
VRLVRFLLLALLCLFALSLVVALGAPETGPIEDVVLAVGVVGVIAVASPVRRLGATPR